MHIDLSDKEFLSWLRDRLIHVYGERPGYGFIYKLEAIIKNTPASQNSPIGDVSKIDPLKLNAPKDDIVSTQVIVCNTCNGYGFETVRASAYDSEEKECFTCKGSGRLVKTVTLKPYVS